MKLNKSDLVVPEGESRWLIERIFAKGQPAQRTEFWLGIVTGDIHADSFSACGGKTWTTNAIEAARFSSQKIAESLRYRYFHPEAQVYVEEHIFQCGISASPQASEREERDPDDIDMPFSGCGERKV